MTVKSAPLFAVELAQTDTDLEAAQKLRYQVFITELGGTGSLVDHENMLERDRFDPFFDHLLLKDVSADRVVGVYRVMRHDQAQAAGGFYSASEYDLGPLLTSGRRLLELGRSCLHADYRGGSALYHLWNGLAAYIERHDIEVLFGVASFHGTDAERLAEPLSLLHHRHLAPKPLRVRARAEAYQPMDMIADADLDRRRAVLQIPPLIRAYLRLGGCVGQGAFIDHTFNTTDVCLMLDTARMNEKQARFYQGQSGRA